VIPIKDPAVRLYDFIIVANIIFKYIVTRGSGRGGINSGKVVKTVKSILCLHALHIIGSISVNSRVVVFNPLYIYIICKLPLLCPCRLIIVNKYVAHFVKSN